MYGKDSKKNYFCFNIKITRLQTITTWALLILVLVNTFCMKHDYAVIVPMANEQQDFIPFVEKVKEVLDETPGGKVYLIVDKVSVDNTRELCENLQKEDPRFQLVWSPENKNVVDAYIKGYRVALEHQHEIIIEMDAGLSHDPSAIPLFLRVLNEGNHCAFGSRFINGGSITDSNWKRTVLSKVGTILANILPVSYTHLTLPTNREV